MRRCCSWNEPFDQALSTVDPGLSQKEKNNPKMGAHARFVQEPRVGRTSRMETSVTHFCSVRLFKQGMA